MQTVVGAQQGQRGRRETGLHDGLLVGEVEDDELVGEGHHRRRRVPDDGGRTHTGVPQPGQQVQHLGRGTGPGQRDDPVVAAMQGELRGGEGVGLPLAHLLAQGGGRLGHVVRGPAPDDRGTLPRLGQQRPLGGGQFGGPLPALGLCAQLVRDVAHGGSLAWSVQFPAR